MATVSEIQTEGFISCIDPRCPGYEQRPVLVTRRTVAFSYQDNGGDGAIPQTAIERETVAIVQTDEPCDYCGKPTVRAEFERPEYAQVSGQDQLALLDLNQQRQIHDVQKTVLERDRADLEREKEMLELRKTVEKQQEAIQELLTRPRGPGRPRKEPEGE